VPQPLPLLQELTFFRPTDFPVERGMKEHRIRVFFSPHCPKKKNHGIAQTKNTPTIKYTGNLRHDVDFSILFFFLGGH
jgi:hypothetical protein